mmetsp:Transcript_92023/g.177356  ORF Transcript_92023/g.177356 Transcript_92023/m.177356 type:complete len:995 (-) Transcript_92023:165-3149(-)|eukprot:CAMPEP_0172698948 /NCGR_PEP_ID=MMETSP1074-20121228/29825_1 /TAXON_ID=2916 /ORGANISM="Ceratium fusus, Strain PA161109" /LENGTH=994 /DNA_ID=CAMNT_0013520061 /DNA_START=54 /DNA_END=3038 /DNA_ORIENTATION=-
MGNSQTAPSNPTVDGWDFSRETWAFECHKKGTRWSSGTGGWFEDASRPSFEVLQVATRRLGGGAFGAVYRGRCHGSEVAAKAHHAIMHPDEYGLDDKEILSEILQSLVQELRMMAQLRHEHLLEFRGVAYYRDIATRFCLPAWILTAVAECGTLHRMIHAAEPLKPLHIHEVGRQVASGLQCLHESGIVHRDIKSKNLLLMADGRVVIADLGLAKMLHRIGSLTTGHGTACGSPNYLGPEGSLSQSPSRDIYALGAVLCESLLQQEPEPSLRAEQVQTSTSIAEKAGCQTLASAIHAAMSVVPADRPAAAALERHLAAPGLAAGFVAAVLSRHAQHAAVATACCKRLLQMDICSDGSATSYESGMAAAEEAIAAAISLLAAHLQDSGIQEVGLTLLTGICCGREDMKLSRQQRLAEGGAIQSVIRALSAHLHTASVQRAATHLLAELCKGQDDVRLALQQRACDEGAMRSLVVALKVHKQNADVLKACLTALTEICSSTKCVITTQQGSGRRSSHFSAVDGNAVAIKQCAINEGAIYAVVSALQVHPHIPLIQQWAALALRNMCYGADAFSRDFDERKQRVKDAGAIPYVVEALRSHPHHANAQEAVASFLAELCSGAGDSKHARRKVAADEGAISAIVAMLRAHRDTATVQETGAWCLSEICAGMDGHALARQRTAADAGAISSLVAAIATHVKHKGVPEAGLSAIDCICSRVCSVEGVGPDRPFKIRSSCSFCTRDDEIATQALLIKRVAVAEGVITAGISAVRAHADNIIIQARGLRALRNLCKYLDTYGQYRGEHHQRLVEQGAVGIAVAALLRHPQQAVVQEAGIGLLEEISRGTEDTALERRRAVAEHSVIPAVVAAMDVHAHDAGVQEAAANLLAELCNGTSINGSDRASCPRQAAADAGAIPAAVTALRLHPQSIIVQLAGTRLLGEICNGHDEGVMGRRLLAKQVGARNEILAARGTFPDDDRLAKASSEALRWICNVGDQGSFS